MEPNTFSPKNFFLQAGIVVTLYASAIAFLTYIFNIINAIFPDTPYFDGRMYSEGMRVSIAVLMVFFPAFILVSSIFRKNIPTLSLKDNKLRKWLIYLTLFLASVAIATDVVVLISTFLNGIDLTGRFLLKCFAVFVVCGSIFYFCLKDVKGYWDVNTKQAKIYAWIVYTVVAISVIGGLFYVGSPATQRKLNEDAQRVNDLMYIQDRVVSFYQLKTRLPQSIEELRDPLSYGDLPRDPKSQATYEYINKGNLSFSLCAQFELESQPRNSPTKPLTPFLIESENWQHSSGRVCFDRTIDPELYPIIKK